MTGPRAKPTPREVDFAHNLSEAIDAGCTNLACIHAMVDALRQNDPLMSELMALAARAGKCPESYNGLEFCAKFETEGATLGPCWFHAGQDDLPITHYLPEPADPDTPLKGADNV